MASLLNVRARPGVAYGNPPVDRLSSGTEVDIYEKLLTDGAMWYRIGVNRWVHSGWVQWISEPEPTPPPPEPGEAIGRGVVIADGLNVRARPGVRPDNPPIGELGRGEEVQIYEKQTYDGDVWYRIGVGRWVHGGWVEWIGEPETPPVPPPPGPEEPPGEQPLGQGVVTTGRLNVRSRPGVSPDNPPVAQLTRDTTVNIYEERIHEGGLWYRIGVDRWVHSGWVRRVGEVGPTPVPSQPVARGVVTASLLNVRARPGVRSDSPVIDHLWSGEEVDVFSEQIVEGAVWYSIGVDRWVHSDWVRVLQRFEQSAAVGESVLVGATLSQQSASGVVSLPVGWVTTQSLNVRSMPSTAPENPPVDTVYHNQLLRILETRQAEGAEWYRIGENRWVHGTYVAVARYKARPSSIGASERWVGVSLRDQTVVAYEGDRPVYAAMAATGLPGTPTVQGIFRTWSRVPSGRMVGPGYYIEDVTWTCYFYSGYSLHTAYWHDAFGAPRSHGCVNLSPYDAWWIFRWSEPGGSKSPTVYVYWA
jgi:uncharacterized protein YgiM (DUF1202 family)